MIDSVEVAAGVLDDVVTLIVEVPDPLIDEELNVAVAPDGNPLTVSSVVPLNPLRAVVVIEYVVDDPGVAVRDDGDAEIVKSPAGGGGGGGGGGADVGTIWIPLIGARIVPPTGAVGTASIVNSVAVTLNLT